MNGRFVATVAAAALLLASCGGPDVTGTYTCPENTTLELRDDGTFLGIDGEQRYEGSYAVEDDLVLFAQNDGNTTDGILQEDGSIRFGDDQVCVPQG